MNTNIKNPTLSSWLYSDKALTKKVDATAVDRFFESYWAGKRKTPMYFYDGNNGDKHMLTGWSINYKTGTIEWVMGVNLTQCHLPTVNKGWMSKCYKTGDAVAENLKPIESGIELMSMLNRVHTYNW